MTRYLRLLPPVYMVLLGWLTHLAATALPATVWNTGGVSITGWAILLSGLAIELSSAARFFKQKTTVNPHGEPSMLVTGGLFRYSRNPMYVGQALMLTGWGLIYGYLLIVVAAPLYALVITYLFIRPEEDRLRGLFGEDYDAYCKRVRRWL